MLVRFRSRATIAGIAVAIAGCSPDRSVAPRELRVAPSAPSADIADIAIDPILYSQTSDINAVTDVIGPGTTFVADEFVVPAGQVWTVESLIVSGQLDDASLPYSFRADVSGHPGPTIRSATQPPNATDDQTCCRSVRDYLFTLPSSLTLSAGTYWFVLESSAASEATFSFQRTAAAQGSVVLTSENGGSAWEGLGAEGIAFSVFGTVKLTQSIAFDPATPNAATAGTNTTITATASSSLTVAFTAGPSNVCTLSGTTLALLAVGTCAITANQAGNAQFLPAPQATHEIAVQEEDVPELLPQTITFPAITPNPSFVGSERPLGATASSNLAVSYTSLTPDICLIIDNESVWLRDSGECTVAADQPGDATYAVADRETQSVTVQRVPQTIVFTSTPPVPGYVNGIYAVGATGGGSGFSVVITTSTPNVCMAAENLVHFTGVGTCVIAVNQPGNIMYAPAPQVTQTVSVDYRFNGFSSPVNSTGINSFKAGRTLPLKWRLTDDAGMPVTTLTTATITVADLSCSAGSTSNQAEESTSGGSGLQNLGDGYYQLNWKVPGSYAKSCKTLQLDLGEGSGMRTASFAFTK